MANRRDLLRRPAQRLLDGRQRLEQALDRVGQKIAEAPKLIPVYSHRFLPSEPLANGNPVLSVWQTDIIIYHGPDLESYFEREFGLVRQGTGNGTRVPRRIRSWSDIIGPQNRSRKTRTRTSRTWRGGLGCGRQRRLGLWRARAWRRRSKQCRRCPSGPTGCRPRIRE